MAHWNAQEAQHAPSVHGTRSTTRSTTSTPHPARTSRSVMAFRSRSVSAQQSRTAAPETTPTRTPGDHSERAPTARYGRPPGTPAHSWRSTEEVDLVAVRFPHYLLTGHLGRSMWVTVFPLRRPWSRLIRRPWSRLSRLCRVRRHARSQAPARVAGRA